MDVHMDWLVVATKPQQESRAEVNLRRQMFEVYCPRFYSRACMKPLFPSYLFVKLFPGMAIRSIPSTYGVRNLICVGDQPATVSDSAIREIRSREANDGVIRLCPFNAGDAVMWGHIPAIFEGMIDDDRCGILFGMLGRTNHKVLRIRDLEPAAEV